MPPLPIDAAMIFAAGLGRRMLPLTDRLPKPLVPVSGKALIDYSLDMLAEAKIQSTVVNTHYLPHLIAEHLKPRETPEIILSHEEALLETGGGLIKALPLLNRHHPQPALLTLNSDVIFTKYDKNPVHQLLSAWNDSKMKCLLLLCPVEHAIGYDGKGDFNLTPSGQVQKGETNAYVFTGLQLIGPEALKLLPPAPCSLNTLYPRLIERGELYGLPLQGTWLHIGTAQNLQAAEQFLHSWP